MLDRREELEENEYSFEEGVNEAVRRIYELFNTQDFVVVSVGGGQGDDRDIGKTSTSAAILQNFSSLVGIPFISVNDSGGLNAHVVNYLKRSMEIGGRKKAVIMLNAQGTAIDSGDPIVLKRRNEINNRHLLKISTEAGLPLGKIDLQILVYRPDRPVSENEKRSVDLTIRNEFAKNKPETRYV